MASAKTARQARSRQQANGPLMARKIRKNREAMTAQAGKHSVAWAFVVERVTRIELALSAWEADVLPLNYTRVPGRSAGSGCLERPARTSYRMPEA